MTKQRDTLWQTWRPALRASVAAIALATVSLPTEAARPCMTPTEASAEDVRALQSGLMVAALKCVHKPQLYLEDSYKQFVGRFQPELKFHAGHLISYFRRAYGRSYNNHLDDHITNLANQFSLLTFRDENFCESMAELAAHVLTVTPERMRAGQFDAELLRVNYARVCVPDPIYSARPRTGNTDLLHADFPNETEVDGSQPYWIAEDDNMATADGGPTAGDAVPGVTPPDSQTPPEKKNADDPGGAASGLESGGGIDATATSQPETP